MVVDATEEADGEEGAMLSRLRRQAQDAGCVISYTVYTAAYQVGGGMCVWGGWGSVGWSWGRWVGRACGGRIL